MFNPESHLETLMTFRITVKEERDAMSLLTMTSIDEGYLLLELILRSVSYFCHITLLEMRMYLHLLKYTLYVCMHYVNVAG